MPRGTVVMLYTAFAEVWSVILKAIFYPNPE
jgi:hypothetical protein